MELYSITDLGPSASTVLAQAVPRAVITAGARADQLAIVATAADHEKLKTVLSQLQGSKTTQAAKELVVYPIKGITPTSVLQVLQPLVDADVQLTVDPAGQQLFVRAFADKQQQIKTAVEQITATLAARGERSTKTYLIGAPNADEAQEVLTALFPDAKIVTDADRKMIVATATAEQHTTIGEIAEQMKGNPLDGDRPVPAVYSLKNTSATEVQTLLQSMYSRFDNVRLSVNEKTGRLIVLARKEQQEAVRVLIEELDGQTEPIVKQELAIFRLKPQMDGLAVQQALQPLLPKSAQVTADRIGRQLFVSAPAEDMAAVRELVQQMLDSSTQSEGLETRSYRLRPFEADEAQEVLTRLFADATFVTDVSQEILVATATVPQHETIAKVVEQMTSVAPIQNAPQAIAYPLRSADGENAVDVFDAMFRRSDNVRVSFDSGTRSLIAVARPDQHAIIKALIEQLEPAEGASDPRSLEVYALQGMDGLTAVEVAEGVLRSVDPAATVSWEKTSKQLIVSTTPAGQQEVTRAFARFQDSDPREMDVIQLRMLSASAAQNAIEGLYGDSFTKDDSYPVIQADEDSQQLLVRGSKKQLQDIRTLLIKMGETGLSATGTTIGEGNRNLRVIPIQGDVEPTLKKIQDLWPRVRNNPIRVLRPGAEVTPVDPQSPQGPAVPDERAVPDASKAGQFSVPAESLHVDEPVSPEDKSAAPQAVIDSPAGAAEATAAALAQAAKLPADIVIIPGADHITIASDDVDALDQLESILRATTSRAPGAIASRNRDFSVYQLRNAGAEEVAETLESIYESRAGMLAFGSVVIVPEARMNALIVYGGRSDRDRIEQLLEILDTEKLPDSGRIFKTQVIPVKHADAEKLESVIKGIYRTEMTAGGTRRAIEIPAGIDSSVANVLRQINAASSAPLLTIEVQSETNSLVIKAPQNLIDELSELVTQLDESAATNRARGVTLVPLKQTNTRRVMRILNDVLD
jgi:type II secretory pathway component GspD/PulD (secretin)